MEILHLQRGGVQLPAPSLWTVGRKFFPKRIVGRGERERERLHCGETEKHDLA